MIAVDTDILVHAHRRGSPKHAAARRRIVALASPSVELLLPGRGFPTLLLEAIREAGAIGSLVFGAQIVALCREAGVSTLLTEDREAGAVPANEPGAPGRRGGLRWGNLC